MYPKSDITFEMALFMHHIARFYVELRQPGANLAYSIHIIAMHYFYSNAMLTNVRPFTVVLAYNTPSRQHITL